MRWRCKALPSKYDEKWVKKFAIVPMKICGNGETGWWIWLECYWQHYEYQGRIFGWHCNPEMRLLRKEDPPFRRSGSIRRGD